MANTTLDVSSYDSVGYVNVTWDNTDKEADWLSWRVYRRPDGGTWELVYDTPVDQANYEWHDWWVPANASHDWVVVQNTSTGETAKSDIKSGTPVSTHYWLVHPTDESQSVRLENVTGDAYSTEYESEALNLIGRGRKVDKGSRWGISGSLDAQIRDKPAATAAEQLVILELLEADQGVVHVRNPFGDVIQSVIELPDVERLSGVGTREFVDISLIYLEVV